MPPKGVYRDISLGGCVLKVMVVAHIPTPTPQDHAASCIPTVLGVGRAGHVGHKWGQGCGTCPPGLTSSVPTATGALLAPYLDGVNSCSPNPEKVGELFPNTWTRKDTRPSLFFLPSLAPNRNRSRMTDPRPGAKALLLSHQPPQLAPPGSGLISAMSSVWVSCKGRGLAGGNPHPRLLSLWSPGTCSPPRAKRGVGQPPQSISGFAMPTTTPAEPLLRRLGGRQFPALGKVGLEPC